MKKLILSLIAIASSIGIFAEVTENGSVKEYHGKENKTALPGVELMIKGAPSTISDGEGNFSLRFATLKAGDKVDYTEIYKDGYVIFNKDALDDWRISNNGRPFTIIMCKESDFRALKKKFYGIIEKSYYNEYLKQKERAEKSIADRQRLADALDRLRKEYDEKMSNINTYVELFSRIDQNEMDSIEAKSLQYLELEQIDEAIRIYEELQLRRRMDTQIAKWNAADEMRRAADGMESEAQADLLSLVGKMQKQISLYLMGGYEYNAKRYAMMRDLVELLNRLRPVTGTRYDEELGQLLVDLAETIHPSERLAEYRKAAQLPSVAGLLKFAERYETFQPEVELVDTIRQSYFKALQLTTSHTDSVKIYEKLRNIPDGIVRHSDGNDYAYRLIGDSEVALTSFGPYYSTHLEGDVTLPTTLNIDGATRTVTEIGNFAFGNNWRLRRVKLPRHCHKIGREAFMLCDSLRTIVVNPELDTVAPLPLTPDLEFPEIPRNPEWLMGRWQQYVDRGDTTVAALSLLSIMGDSYLAAGQPATASDVYETLAGIYLQRNEFDSAIATARRARAADKGRGLILLAYCHQQAGDISAAIKEVKKGLSKSNPYGYNLLANLYIADGDYKNAHKTIDTAISAATNPTDSANFIDTKGEVYLRQGDETNARKYYEMVIAADPDLYTDTSSVLYEHFNPAPPAKADYDEQEQIKRERQNDRNLAIALIALEYVRPRVEALDGMNFEEMKFSVLSTIKNLEADNEEDFYAQPERIFYGALMTAAEHLYSIADNKGLQFDNEWVGMIDCDGRHGIRDSIPGGLPLLIILREIAARLPCEQLTEDDCNRALSFSNYTTAYLETLSGREKDMFADFLQGHDVDYFEMNYKCDKDSVVSFLRNTITDMQEYINNITEPSAIEIPRNTDYAGRFDEELADFKRKKNRDRTVLRNYIELIQACARIQYDQIPKLENFRSADYEELLSIGLIATQILIKNKTPEQLAKYNTAYIGTAVTWAIRNEMKLRYPWYVLFKEDEAYKENEAAYAYDDRGVDGQKAMLRLAVYKTVTTLHYYVQKMRNEPQTFDFLFKKAGMMDDDREQYFTELDEMWAAIENARGRMPAEYRECYDYVFGENADYARIFDKFDPLDIQRMLNVVKEVLESAKVTGY